VNEDFFELQLKDSVAWNVTFIENKAYGASSIFFALTCGYLWKWKTENVWRMQNANLSMQ